MQDQLHAAIAKLMPPKRRSHRQSWERKEIVARRKAACAMLERVIDEAVRDGVAREDIERIGFVIQDAIRQKLEARAYRPLGVPSLGEAIQVEEAIEGAMASLEIEQLRAPTPGGITRLKELGLRHCAAMLNVVRACDAYMARGRT